MTRECKPSAKLKARLKLASTRHHIYDYCVTHTHKETLTSGCSENASDFPTTDRKRFVSRLGVVLCSKKSQRASLPEDEGLRRHYIDGAAGDGAARPA